MKARTKFLVGSGIIVVTLVSLAYVGFTQSKTYYHTISEIPTLQAAALHQRMRVSGNVRNGSIAHRDGRVDFVLEEQRKTLPVSYVGRDPLPDTFKDGAQALVEGRSMPDGQLRRRAGAGEMRIEVSSQPGGCAGAAAAWSDHERSGAPRYSEQELNAGGGIRWIFSVRLHCCSRFWRRCMRSPPASPEFVTRRAALTKSARNAGMAVFGLVTLAVASLEYFFFTDNFSMAYVAEHSNRALPLLL